MLTKIREMEDAPKTIEKSGFSTGIKDILAAEAVKWGKLWRTKEPIEDKLDEISFLLE